MKLVREYITTIKKLQWPPLLWNNNYISVEVLEKLCALNAIKEFPFRFFFFFFNNEKMKRREALWSIVAKKT